MTPEASTEHREKSEVLADIERALIALAESLGFKQDEAFAAVRTEFVEAEKAVEDAEGEDAITDSEAEKYLQDWYELAKAFLASLPKEELEHASLGASIAYAEAMLYAGYAGPAFHHLNSDEGALMVADQLNLTLVKQEIDKILDLFGVLEELS